MERVSVPDFRRSLMEQDLSCVVSDRIEIPTEDLQVLPFQCRRFFSETRMGTSGESSCDLSTASATRDGTATAEPFVGFSELATDVSSGSARGWALSAWLFSALSPSALFLISCKYASAMGCGYCTREHRDVSRTSENDIAITYLLGSDFTQTVPVDKVHLRLQSRYARLLLLVDQ